MWPRPPPSPGGRGFRPPRRWGPRRRAEGALMEDWSQPHAKGVQATPPAPALRAAGSQPAALRVSVSISPSVCGLWARGALVEGAAGTSPSRAAAGCRLGWLTGPRGRCLSGQLHPALQKQAAPLALQPLRVPSVKTRGRLEAPRGAGSAGHLQAGGPEPAWAGFSNTEPRNPRGALSAGGGAEGPAGAAS